MAASVTVSGLRELSALFAAAGKQAKRELTAELRDLAEPIRADAEQLVASGIRRIGPNWSKMRVGVTRTLVYVAPKERGIKTRGPDPRRRPKFADLVEPLMDDALQRNEGHIERDVESLFGRLADDWNRR